MKKILAYLLLSAGVTLAAEPGPLVSKQFDSGKYSQLATDCDRLAGHPDDPFHVGTGLEKPEMDLPRAVAACQTDLQKDPGNPRLLYQLARSLAYSGRGAESLPLINRSASLGYPQALFVAGYLYLEGLYQAPKDLCRAGELIRQSAQVGRMAGQVGFPAWHLQGRFKGCSVRQDVTEMIGFLNAAKATKPEFYHALLIDDLLRQLAPQAAQAPPNK